MITAKELNDMGKRFAAGFAAGIEKAERRTKMKFLLIKCIKDINISGRNEDGTPDHCFVEEKEYDMCLDERKNECFTLNEVNVMHFFTYENNWYFAQHFEVVKELQEEDFVGDELRMHRLKKMAKEKHNYEE
ncbi:TPA: hypothetical protein QCU25_001229 [Bacillus anthracis]